MAGQLFQQSPRLFITERNSKIQFLVNTGSDVFVLSRKDVAGAVKLFQVHDLRSQPFADKNSRLQEAMPGAGIRGSIFGTLSLGADFL